MSRRRGAETQEPRVLEPNPSPDDAEFDRSLRPRTLEEFVGQTDVKEHLVIVLGAAKQRGEQCPHLLFTGPPGLGKTSFAHIVAAEMDAQIRVTSGPALERPGDLVAILSNLEAGHILFVDEIHRLHRAVEEVLYPAMEDSAVDIVLGKGPAARTLHYRLEPFTLIGATTRTGMITGPLRDRFGFVSRLDYYSTDELTQVVERSAGLLGVEIEAAGAKEIATRSRGTPRIANRLLHRVRDFSQVRADGHISANVASEGLAVFHIDPLGLDRIDLAILRCICQTHGGGPVGVTTVAMSVGEEPETIEDVYEPYLVQTGFIARTPRGRVATDAAWRHLGLEPPRRTVEGQRLF
ncbi:MAG: Holliday junction branch migration DNA helicase RuvB [Actinomycetota bacterium]